MYQFHDVKALTLISSVLAVSVIVDPIPKSTVRHSEPHASKIIC